MTKALITSSSQIVESSNPFIEAIERFLFEIKRDMQQSTYRTYESKIRFFKGWMASNPFHADSNIHEVLKAFRMAVRDQEWSAATKNLAITVVKSFFKSLLEKGIIDRDPTIVLKRFNDSNDLKKSALSKEQVAKILEHLNNDTSYNAKRNRALFILLTMNGLRVGEAAALNIEDIGMEQGRYVAYLKRKGYEDKSNYVVLQDKTYTIIKNLIGDRICGAVFASSKSGENLSPKDISRIVKTILVKAGFDDDKITAHSLRHTYSIFAIDGGASLLALSKSLNHANLSTTQKYLTSYNRLKHSAEDAVNLDF